MSELIISVSGLRGVVGETLTPEVAMRYATAFSQTMPQGSFLVTRDSRPHGAMLADAVHTALNAAGRSTVDAGIAATPTTGILIQQFQAVGGIQISASHNPVEFNGMKLFGNSGRVIPKKDGQYVLDHYHNGTAVWAAFDRIGLRSTCKDTVQAHCNTVLNTVDKNAIAAKKFNVLLDSNRGAGSLLGEVLLNALGCETVILGKQADGEFEHTPEPAADNLKGVCRKVKELGVDVAFCQDPDADRLAVIDANGNYLGEEYTVALCLSHILRIASTENKHPFKRKKGAVVINCATSRMSEDIAARFGVPIFRSAVGEANVTDLMIEQDAMFGGEGNGGPIDPAVGLVRDSFVGMATILDAMAATGKTVRQLADEIPPYELVKRKTAVELAAVPAMLDKAAEAFKHLPCDHKDGLRIDHGDAWVLLRGSNTEAIIRIFAEAPTRQQAEQLCDEAEKVLK